MGNQKCVKFFGKRARRRESISGTRAQLCRNMIHLSFCYVQDSYLKPVSIYSTIVTDRILNRVLKHQKIRLCTLYVHCSTVGLYGGEERFGLSFEK